MLLYLFQVPNNEICTLAVTCYLSSNLICLLYKGAENISKCFLFPCLNCNFPSFQHGNLMKKKKNPTWTITLDISLAWSLKVSLKIYSCQRCSQKTNSKSTQASIKSKLLFHLGPLVPLFSCPERITLTDSYIL